MCEVDSEGSEDLRGQESDALEIDFLFLGQLRPLTADPATDALWEPLYYVKAKAGLFAMVSLGEPLQICPRL